MPLRTDEEEWLDREQEVEAHRKRRAEGGPNCLFVLLALVCATVAPLWWLVA